MPFFQKKPIAVEAFKLTPDSMKHVLSWCGGEPHSSEPKRGITGISINTLEGTMVAVWGDWIIKGIKGEFYPCKLEIFEATYEPLIKETE